MRLMSFAATWQQILEGKKDVTRRLGWADLKPGDKFQAIQKGQGLKKGQKVVRGPVLECVSNKSERIIDISYKPFREDQFEVIREGFGDLHSMDFVRMFCKMNRCDCEQIVNRIEFKRA